MSVTIKKEGAEYAVKANGAVLVRYKDIRAAKAFRGACETVIKTGHDPVFASFVAHQAALDQRIVESYNNAIDETFETT